MTTNHGSLLLVDDDPMLRGLLARHLEHNGFSVTCVADGPAALVEIDRGGHELVLLDIEMDGLSGLEILKVIRQKHPPTELPVIMATVKDDPQDVVEALNLGANDYVTKPFAYSVVLARVRTHLSLKRSVDQIRRLEQTLAQQNQRMKRDLEAAIKVQEALLPDGLPPLPGACFGWRFRPCTELAGDLLNIIPLDERRVALFVLDVVGHGVAAALLAVMVNRVLAHSSHSTSRPVLPAEVADLLNKEFPWDSKTSQFFTIQYGVLELDTGLYRFVTAGHPGPAYLPHDDRPRNLVLPGSPIGLADEPYEEHCLTLRPGDRLWLYSDGIPDATNQQGTCFREDRLLAALEQGRNLPLTDSVGVLLRAVEDWCGDRPPNDDISILAVERL
jgi:sigma-B regulation protein RsbU (phosphoserine phosphatase)